MIRLVFVIKPYFHFFFESPGQNVSFGILGGYFLNGTNFQRVHKYLHILNNSVE